MKLLSKKQANVEAQKRQTASIKEGLELENIVSTLRETRTKEEQGLQQFREASMRDIRRDIEDGITQRDTLKKEIERLRDERVRLSAPPDLTKVWDEAKRLKAENEEWSDRLAEHEISLLAREGSCDTRTKSLDEREEVVAANEATATLAVSEAVELKREAKETLATARNKAQAVLSKAELIELELGQREAAAQKLKRDAEKQAEYNQQVELNLAAREKALKVRYDTLLKAERYVKEKYGIDTERTTDEG